MIDSFFYFVEQMFLNNSWYIPLIVFLGGVLTSIGPCNVAMVPLMLAYIGRDSESGSKRGFTLALSFTIGTAVTFVILGLIIAFVGGLFGVTQTVFSYVAAVVCLVMGLFLLDLVPFQLPSLATISKKIGIKTSTNSKKYRGHKGAFSLGMILGLAGSQCGTPILFVILTYVLLKGQISYGALLLFIYALGRGLPLIIAGSISGFIKTLPKIAQYSKKIEIFVGIFLILLSFYLFWIA